MLSEDSKYGIEMKIKKLNRMKQFLCSKMELDLRSRFFGNITFGIYFLLM